MSKFAVVGGCGRIGEAFTVSWYSSIDASQIRPRANLRSKEGGCDAYGSI